MTYSYRRARLCAGETYYDCPYYEDYIDETGILGPMTWWNFADWAKGWKRGVPPGAADGHSAVITLQLIYNLNLAEELAEAFGRKADAEHYRKLSQSLNRRSR